MKLAKNKPFFFSVSTNAFQIEGGRNLDGRTDSIWDEFTKRNFYIPPKGSTEREINSIDVAADFYHKYKTDVKIMKKLGINAFTYNMDWTRIFSKNSYEINAEGLEWTTNLFDELLANKITPIPILYHWDTPLWAEILGGLNNVAFLDWFRNYVATVFKHLGRKTDYWFVNDENSTFTILGYLHDYFPPGKNDPFAFVQALHMLNMSGAVAKEEFIKAKKLGYVNKQAVLGIDHDWSPPIAYQQTKNNVAAIKEYNQWMKNLFLDPNLKGTYPKVFLRYAKNLGFRIDKKDLKYLRKYRLDFIGWNYYRPAIIASKKDFLNENDFIKPSEQIFDSNAMIVYPNHGVKYTKWKWVVDPSQLVVGAKQLAKEYHKPLMIVENGYGDFDDKSKREINDLDRIEYLKEHLDQVFLAIENKVNFIGYSLWTYCDIFSPSAGYRKDYGLVSVDFNSPKKTRTPKLSFFWYQQTIKNRDTDYDINKLEKHLTSELKKWKAELE